MSDPGQSVDALRGKIEAGERGGSDADRKRLIEFSDQLFLLSKEYSDYRHLKLLRHCTRMAEEVGGLDDTLENRAAAEDIVRWINQTYENEETNRDYRSAIRVFGKRVTRSDEPPESLAWVPTGTSRTYDPIPNANELLSWSEVQTLADHATNRRDEALLAVQFEAGLRSGELRGLTIGDIFDSQHSVGLHVQGKTGERAVHLIVATPYLDRWLDVHPDQHSDSAPLWSKLESAEEQSYNAFMHGFKRPAKRAGIEKPVTPTNFRKSNTRWLVRQGMSQAEIEDRQGRKRGSEHTARYIARFGEESSEKRYAELHGKDVASDRPDSFDTIECFRCGQETDGTRDFCLHCQAALDHEARQFLEDVTTALEDQAIDSEDVEARRDAIQTKRTIERKPTVLDDDEIRHRLSSLID